MVKASGIFPNTGEIVLSAIKKLTKNTGWTTRTIIKFIKLEYRNHDPILNRKVRRALKRGVKLGFLEVENGRYRLNELSRLTHAIGARETRPRRVRPKKTGKGLTIRSE